MMKTLKKMLLTAAVMLSLPAAAQDFGYPKDKAFYKAHWDEVVKDLELEESPDFAQYVLYDFDKDGKAELFLRLFGRDEYLYSIRNNKVVRVSETSRDVEDEFWLGSFYAHFTAPVRMLLDKPLAGDFEAGEQQFYDKYDIPRVWFEMRPKIEGAFSLKNVINALDCFDCEHLSDAFRVLETGKYSKDEVEEYVMDVQNGYASVQLKTETMNSVELCYWNMAYGEKLLAMHYHFSEVFDGKVDWFEQVLFMKYDPKTKYLTPIVAPIQGFDFRMECNFSLPRKGKNIRLIAAEDDELKWTGNGFKY